MPEDKQVYIRLRSKTSGEWFVNPDLRATLIEAAAAAETSLNDIVNQVLAERFGVRYEPSGRRSRPSDGEEEYLIVRLAPRIRRKIMLTAATNGLPWMDVLRRALCDAYDLPMPDAVAA